MRGLDPSNFAKATLDRSCAQDDEGERWNGILSDDSDESKYWTPSEKQVQDDTTGAPKARLGSWLATRNDNDEGGMT